MGGGTWIKYRGSIRTDPKFFGLVDYFWHEPGAAGIRKYVVGASDEIVTLRPSRRVTEDVTLASLLRVWFAVNVHCKILEEDAIMRPMRLKNLDDIAGIEGFSEAMRAVGWVKVVDDNCLLFPKFLHYNQPACMRQQPKTGAERQASYRARKKQAQDHPMGEVTKVTKSDADKIRVDKSREEKKERRKKETPSRQSFDPGSLELPFPSNQFADVWLEWTQHRRQVRKPLTELACRKQLASMASWGEERAIIAIEHTIRQGWVGLREPDTTPNGKYVKKEPI